MRQTLLENLRKALKALIELGRPRRVIEELAVTIRTWGRYREELKEEMVELLRAEFQALLALQRQNSGG